MIQRDPGRDLHRTYCSAMQRKQRVNRNMAGDLEVTAVIILMLLQIMRRKNDFRANQACRRRRLSPAARHLQRKRAFEAFQARQRLVFAFTLTILASNSPSNLTPQFANPVCVLTCKDNPGNVSRSPLTLRLVS